MTVWDGALTKGMLHDVMERTAALRQTNIALKSTSATCELCWEITDLSKPQLFVCNMENVTIVS